MRPRRAILSKGGGLLLLVKKATRIDGEITPPGDKSIAHRAFILSAAAGGGRLENVPRCGAVMSTVNCLRALGIKIKFSGKTALISGNLRAPKKPLDAGNSATAARLLMGLLSGQPFDSVISGDTSLRRRPMERVAAPLRLMGARIKLSPQGCAPVRITGGKLRPVDCSPPEPSAQVKSAVLLAGLFSDGKTTVRERIATRDHTERLLPAFGAKTKGGRGSFSVRGGKLKPASVKIPGDFSCAAPFIAAACLLKGSRLRVKNVSLNTRRLGFISALRRMGADIKIIRKTSLPEPVGEIRVRCAPLSGVKIGKKEIPSLIDELPLLAVAATQARGITRVTGAGELRFKESDRLSALGFLRDLGGRIKISPDGFEISGPQKLECAKLRLPPDHRIVMAAAVAGLLAEGETEIKNSGWVKISYPDFFRRLHEIKTS